MTLRGFSLQMGSELSKLPLHLQHEPWNITAIEEELYDFSLGKDYLNLLLIYKLQQDMLPSNFGR